MAIGDTTSVPDELEDYVSTPMDHSRGRSPVHLRGRSQADAEALPVHSRGGSLAYTQHDEASSALSELAELQEINRRLTRMAARLVTERPDLSALVSAASICLAPVIRYLSSTAPVVEPSYWVSEEV